MKYSCKKIRKGLFFSSYNGYICGIYTLPEKWPEYGKSYEGDFLVNLLKNTPLSTVSQGRISFNLMKNNSQVDICHRWFYNEISLKRVSKSEINKKKNAYKSICRRMSRNIFFADI